MCLRIVDTCSPRLRKEPTQCSILCHYFHTLYTLFLDSKWISNGFVGRAWTPRLKIGLDQRHSTAVLQLSNRIGTTILPICLPRLRPNTSSLSTSSRHITHHMSPIENITCSRERSPKLHEKGGCSIQLFIPSQMWPKPPPSSNSYP